MVDEEILASELRRLDRADRMVADTSAIIAAEAEGVLETFASFVEFLVPPQVLAELGPASQARAFLAEARAPEDPATAAKTVSLNTDKAVVQTAATRGLPVFGEDRRILQAVEELGLSAYPFGILCALPVLRGLWSISEARVRYGHFTLNRPYRRDLDAFCRDLFMHLETLGY